ncbi:NACHT domain-containing protein [Amycolatopsis sp. NPDC049159]|uniref:NACHT domain-containing protein n=1 Tax=Amycolatopsis sp. NPDC049159 TaxID=3157210 RepID=UPI0033F2F5CC
MPAQLTYAVVMALVFAFAGFLAKQFVGEGVKHLGQRFWPAVFRSRRRTLTRRELRRYAGGVKATFDSHALGFLATTKVTVSEVYVPLQSEVDGRREDIYGSIRDRGRTVVLGPAGAGKSMLLKYSMVKWADRPADFERVPVFVELFRRNRGEESPRDLVVAALGRGGVKKPERFLDRALADGLLSVFFDGFDEIVTDRRAEVTQQLKAFAEKWPKCQIVVTCRAAVYDSELRPDFDHEVRVAGFDDAAIRRFLRLWFTSKRAGRDTRFEVEQMMAGLRASPPILLLARTPLLLTMIASLHDADPGIGPVLPGSRAEFYELAVQHLLRRDSELGRTRGLATYKAGHKQMALRAIAVRAQGAMAPGTDRRTVPEDELLATITRVLTRFNLEVAHAAPMLEEIVDRSGLLVRVDEGNLLYEFPHLTLQEYLAAMELADSPERLLALYEENPGRWRETVKLWCGGANRDCTPVVERIFAGDRRGKLLALECLAEARQIDETLARAVLRHFEATLPGAEPDPVVVAALGAVAADPGPRGTALRTRLTRAALQRHVPAMLALAATRLRPAVETLSDLATWAPAARVALRSTGELALPVLAERAGTGSTAAVDDIAAIGTASAGVALAELLWDESDVAVRAAWRLAVLVRSPDVEDELSRAETGNPAGEWYDWLWAPFRTAGTGHLAELMGRVGYLIDDRTGARMPDDVGRVDPRLAMPIGVRGASRQYDPAALAGLDLEVGRVARSLGVGVRDHTGNGEALAEIHERDEGQARRLALALFERAGVGVGYRSLLATLPTTVLVRLVVKLSRPGFRADESQWRTFDEDLKAPVVLRPVASVALVVLLAGPYLLGVTRATGSAFGWWPWTAPWEGWATALAALGFLLTGLFFRFGEVQRMTVLAGFFLVLSLPGVLAYAVTTLVDWLGAPVLATAAFVLTVVTTGLVRLLGRREREIANPFRDLRSLDESVLRVRSTVISGREAGQGITRAFRNSSNSR